jgi:hypothetical protein
VHRTTSTLHVSIASACNAQLMQRMLTCNVYKHNRVNATMHIIAKFWCKHNVVGV